MSDNKLMVREFWIFYKRFMWYPVVKFWGQYGFSFFGITGKYQIITEEPGTKMKHLMEFYPEIVLTLPDSVGGSCCLKPAVKETERSQEMSMFAFHLYWLNRDRVELVIPTRCTSRIHAVNKWRNFKARMRLKKLGVKQRPALILDGRIICEGCLKNAEKIEAQVKRHLKFDVI